MQFVKKVLRLCPLILMCACGEPTTVEKCHEMHELLNECGIEVLYSESADLHCADGTVENHCEAELDATLECLQESGSCCDSDWYPWAACAHW